MTLLERLRDVATMHDAPATLGEEAADEIERLQSALAEGAKDAARYRWLRHRTAAHGATGNQAYFKFPEIIGSTALLQGSVAEHLDDGIDALIAKEPK